MAGRGHSDDDDFHGDWWSSLRVQGRRFRRSEPHTRDRETVATLAPPPPPPSPSADPEQLAAVQEKLRKAAEALESARRMRVAVSDHVVAREHEAAETASPPRGRLPLALLAAAVLLAVAAGAAGALVLSPSGDETRAAAPPAPAAPAPDVPRCSDLPAGAASGGAVSCTTGTSLTIAEAGDVLALRELDARVLAVSRRGDALRVRLRIANRTDATQSLDRRVYVSLAGRRLYASPDEPLPARATRTLDLSFPVGDTAATSADLGIVPFGEPADDGARRLGVVRLTLPPR